MKPPRWLPGQRSGSHFFDKISPPPINISAMTNFKPAFSTAIFWLASLVFLGAQVPDEYKSAFYKEVIRPVELGKERIFVQYTESYIDTDGGQRKLRSWFTTFGPHYKPEEAMRKLNLPPGSKAEYFRLVRVPAGMTVYVGKVADGDWDKNRKLVPNGRSTGALQFYIPSDQLHRLTLVGPMMRNRVERENARSHSPNPPDRPTPSPSAPAPPKLRVIENTDRQHIQNVIRRQGDFPGGVIVEPEAKCGLSPSRVRFVQEEGLFLLDDRYRFHPMLADEELAVLAGLAFLNPDKRLAAVAQDRFTNISPQSPVALSLSEADKVLGMVAYGFTMEGFALPDSLAAPGYENPMLAEQRKVCRWWSNWSETFRIAEKKLRGLEPRLFLEFREVGFRLDPATGFVEASDLDLQINFQVFGYDAAGNKVFTDQPPGETFPEIAAAIKHLRENWSWYEARFPELFKARKLAECYALLKFLSAQGAATDGFEPLFEEYRDPFELPVTYDSYNDIRLESEMVQGWAKALKALRWLPDWLIGSEDELRLCHLRLELAMEAQDAQAITKYRKQLAGRIQNLTPSDSTLKAICERLKNDLPYFTASGIGAKQRFAERYAADFPDLSRQHYDACIAWHQKMAEVEPDNFATYERLAALFAAAGDEGQARNNLQKMLPLLKAAAEQGNTSAVFLLGDLLASKNDLLGVSDATSAFDCYQKAAEVGYVFAFTRLANCYLEGIGTDPDTRLAFNWYQKAADVGIAEGQFMVGYFIQEGLTGNPPDPQQAFEHFSKAAEQGHVKAQLYLGLMFLMGEAVEKDMAQGYFWFKRAADSGQSEAAQIARMMEEQGII